MDYLKDRINRFTEKSKQPIGTSQLLNLLEGNMFTVTLPKKLYGFSSPTQYELTRSYILHILDSSNCKYVSAPEHTKQGIIHYHFVVKCDSEYFKISIINRLKKCKQFGFIHMKDTIKDQSGLIKALIYVLEDLEITKRLLNLSYDILNHNLS